MPDGTRELAGPYDFYTEGIQTVTYTIPQMVGDYQIQAVFPWGQYFQPGNIYYLPSQSQTITFFAQQQPVPLSASST